MQPDTFPPLQQGPQVWPGPDMAERQDWIEILSPAEIAEIAAAAAPLAAREAYIAALVVQDFPLPSLAPRLAQIKCAVLEGRGSALLRGLPVQRWPLRLSATAFYGLGLRGDDPTVRIYQTAERQTFHTDSSDIVGLLCLQTAKPGGGVPPKRPGVGMLVAPLDAGTPGAG